VNFLSKSTFGKLCIVFGVIVINVTVLFNWHQLLYVVSLAYGITTVMAAAAQCSG